MASILYTEYGYENWKNWIDVGGFDNISFRRNGRVMKLLTKLAIETYYIPFKLSYSVKKNLGPKLGRKIRYSSCILRRKRSRIWKPNSR